MLIPAGSPSLYLVKRIRESRANIVHIQYPTIGYRFGLAPHLLSLITGKPVVVTLHEFKYTHILRRASCLLFSLRSKHIIFTNREDQERFVRVFSLMVPNNGMIELGSNIPWLPGTTKRGNRICYFGIIRPSKGIEDFIELGRLINEGGYPYILEIIGSPAAFNMAYYQSLKDVTSSLRIEWSVNLGPEQVAARLHEATCAYLPFPGGVSMRRGSLISVMGNGVPVVTTDGPDRPPQMAKAMRFAADPREAVSVISELMRDSVQAEHIAAEARRYLAGFSWPKIAEDHEMVYNKLLMENERC